MIQVELDNELIEVSRHQLFALASRGRIGRQTKIVFDGKVSTAGKIKGIQFGGESDAESISLIQGESVDDNGIYGIASPPQAAVPNPFSATAPVMENPFSAKAPSEGNPFTATPPQPDNPFTAVPPTNNPFTAVPSSTAPKPVSVPHVAKTPTKDNPPASHKSDDKNYLWKNMILAFCLSCTLIGIGSSLLGYNKNLLLVYSTAILVGGIASATTGVALALTAKVSAARFSQDAPSTQNELRKVFITLGSTVSVLIAFILVTNAVTILSKHSRGRTIDAMNDPSLRSEINDLRAMQLELELQGIQTKLDIAISYYDGATMGHEFRFYKTGLSNQGIYVDSWSELKSYIEEKKRETERYKDKIFELKHEY